ncbi:MAG: bacillolysin [Chloroflexota bacterium]
MNRPRTRSLLLIATLAALVALPSAVVAKQPAGIGSTAAARVFMPNPVASLDDQTLTDQKDADYPALAPAYVNVTLTDLDGTGFLCGRWACVVSETGNPAYEPDGTFLYDRHDDRFEQVMGYYWITESQKYIQSLGFGSRYPGINMDSQAIRINQWGVDNSYATDHPKDEMRMGKGGVDDAEDAEVLLHEYGHQMHFSQSATFFNGGDGGAISEGFGDYWAANVVEILTDTPDPACIMDWDATSYDPTAPHCLRRLDSNRSYLTDRRNQVHYDGTIWSQALWEMRQAIGPTKANTAILLAQFGQDGPTMPSLAADIVAQVQTQYGDVDADAARVAFEARDIL